MTDQQKYKLGDVFCVELDNGQYCVGFVARKRKRHGIILCYFFAELYQSLPDQNGIPHLTRERAIAVMKCGDDYLLNGRWPLIGHHKDWESDSWKMPQFYRRADFLGAAWRVTYDEEDLATVIKLEPWHMDETSLPKDALHGARAVEIELTIQLLGREAIRKEREGTFNPDDAKAVRDLSRAIDQKNYSERKKRKK